MTVKAPRAGLSSSSGYMWPPSLSFPTSVLIIVTAMMSTWTWICSADIHHNHIPVGSTVVKFIFDVRNETSWHQTAYLGFWGKQSSAEAVHVSQVHLDAGVGEAELVEAGGSVTRTNIALAREGGDGDGVLQLGLRQVVADAAVDVALRAQEQRQGWSAQQLWKGKTLEETKGVSVSLWL